MIVLRCGHEFCGSCLRQLIHCRLNDGSVVKCPHCREPFTERDVRVINPNAIQRWYEVMFESFIMEHAMEFFHCPTPDCPNVVDVSTYQRRSLLQKLLRKCRRRFHCQVCGKTSCLKCHSHHDETTGCSEWRTGELALKKLVLRQGWMQCPRCRTSVERVSGCDHMYCLCGQRFCYSCGGSTCICWFILPKRIRTHIFTW